MDSVTSSTVKSSTTTNGATTKTVVDKIKKKKKRNRMIWISLAALVVLIIVLVVVKSGKEKAVIVHTEKVSTRTITAVVQATGKVQPETSVKISPEVPGEIIQLPFKEGAQVKKGEMLAEIKPTAIKAQYEAGVAQLEGSKAQVEQAKAQKLTADLALKRTKQLQTKDLSSQADLETAQQAYDVAVANLNAAVHNVNYYENNLTQFSESLRKTSVLSPMDGFITQLISQLGEKVVGTSAFAGTEMMTVSDLSVMNSMVDVDENDVVNVKLGDTARVSINAFPDRTFTGIVIEVANSAELKGTNTQDQSTNFQVKIRLSGFQTGELRPGMSCTAKIETITKQNILTIPNMAVTRRTMDVKKTADPNAVSEVGKKQTVDKEEDRSPMIVFVVDGTRVKAVQVKTGISDNSYVEITEGLKGNEEIVKGDYSAVSKDLDDKKLIKIDNGTGTTDEKKK